MRQDNDHPIARPNVPTGVKGTPALGLEDQVRVGENAVLASWEDQPQKLGAVVLPSVGLDQLRDRQRLAVRRGVAM
jgi:hypothetical protein